MMISELGMMGLPTGYLDQQERCENCRFLRDFDPEIVAVGTCRRYPPVRSKDGSVGRDNLWPTVHTSDWCGEWQPQGTHGCLGEQSCGDAYPYRGAE